MNISEKLLNISLNKKRNFLLLVQFFLIIFIYHTLKDLKDTVVITASDAGAEVIPFIKIWGMLPLAIGASFLFSKIYNRFNREKTLYIIVGMLGLCYISFAFILFPFRDQLYLNHVHDFLTNVLPSGCRGLIAMVCFWHYTLFYVTAELWSVLVLTILFYGYVNDTTTIDESKKFYPLCAFVGNFAGILSGQTSHFFSHNLREYFSWQETVQLMITVVITFSLVIMGINRWLLQNGQDAAVIKTLDKKHATSFKDNLLAVVKSKPLMCIAILVIGFGLTSNLIEVIWKEKIKALYPDPQAFNAYINKITSLIGVCSVCMALLSRWLYQSLSWGKVALITPVALFITTLCFFSTILLPSNYLTPFVAFLNVTPIVLIVTLGSLHYVVGMTAKYTIFDSCKEMAFLSIDSAERLKAKSVIDSIGSRLGKTGASCLYQFLLISFGTASGHIPVIAATSLFMIGISIAAVKQLDNSKSKRRQLQPAMEPQPLEALAEAG